MLPALFLSVPSAPRIGPSTYKHTIVIDYTFYFKNVVTNPTSHVTIRLWQASNLELVGGEGGSNQAHSIIHQSVSQSEKYLMRKAAPSTVLGSENTGERINGDLATALMHL